MPTFERIKNHARHFTTDIEQASFNKLSYEMENIMLYTNTFLKDCEHEEWIYIEKLLEYLSEVCQYIEMIDGNEVLYDDEGTVFVRDVSLSFTYALIAMINDNWIEAKIINGKARIKLLKRFI